MKIPFAKADITPMEEQAVLEVLRNGWVTSGPVMKKLEDKIAKYIGNDVQAIAVNSATSGLHLALEACGIGRGDSVIVPTWTFTATAEVVRYLGAVPILADVKLDTLNIDVNSVEDRLPLNCRAIIPVHFAGRSCWMPEIYDFARQHNLNVIEDAAHALGSLKDSNQPGKVGCSEQSDATVFSFYATKCMTTAEGGAIVSKKPWLLERVKRMRLHGINRDAFARYTSDARNWEYDVVAAGYKYNMPDVLAALGVVQMDRLSQMQGRRTEIAQFYHAYLPDAVKKPEWQPGGSWHLYVIRVKNRDRFIERMADVGVSTSVHFKPLHRMTYWKSFAGNCQFPNADRAFSEVVSLPIYSAMSDAQVEYVVNAVRQCLD